MGIEASGLDNLITASYDLLGVHLRLPTAKRSAAPTIRKGTKAPRGCRKIDSHFRARLHPRQRHRLWRPSQQLHYAAVKAKGLQRNLNR